MSSTINKHNLPDKCIQSYLQTLSYYTYTCIHLNTYANKYIQRPHCILIPDPEHGSITPIFLWRCQWPRQHQLQVEFHFGQVWGKDKFLGRGGTFSSIWGQSKEERKENKERLKSSHRQARAPGVLSQARNYRTRSTAKCFIKGNSLPNSWRWASASCVCLLVSFFQFFSYLHLSIFYSLALCIGKGHIQTSLDHREIFMLSN